MRYLLMLLLAFSLVACDPGAPAGVGDNASEATEDVEEEEDDFEGDSEELEEDD